MVLCSLNLKEFSRSGNGHLGAVQLCFQLGLWQTACRDLRPAGMSLNFVGLRSIVLQGWSLPPKVVTKIAESFAILTFGSSFMHGRFDKISLYSFWVATMIFFSQQHEAWNGARCPKQRSLPLCHPPGEQRWLSPTNLISCHYISYHSENGFDQSVPS